MLWLEMANNCFFVPNYVYILSLYPKLIFYFILTRKIAALRAEFSSSCGGLQKSVLFFCGNLFGKVSRKLFGIFFKNPIDKFCGYPFGKFYQNLFGKLLWKSVWKILRKSIWKTL